MKMAAYEYVCSACCKTTDEGHKEGCTGSFFRTKRLSVDETKRSSVDELQGALQSFIRTVNTTGGVELIEGTHCPVADPDWIDLGTAYITACAVLDVKPEIVNEPEACPGCGCKPGGGYTPGCMDPEGCGYFAERDGKIERRIAEIENVLNEIKKELKAR
jgi:hypothetical protein